MAKLILNTEEARDEVKEKVTGIHINFDAGPPRSIIFYDGDFGARYFFLNEEKIIKAVEELVNLIEADGEEF